MALGFSREEVLGRTTLELGVWSERPFGGREGMLQLLEEQGGLRDVEMLLRRKDGVLRTVLASFEVLEGRGEPALLTTLVDLTERNLMERQPQASEARFRSAYHDAAIGMAMTSRDGRLLEVNVSLCNMLGYSNEELLALSVQYTTHPDDLETDLARASETLAGETASYQLEKRYLYKEGHVMWGHLSVSAVRDDGGDVSYFVAQVQDITARKRYEEQVQVMAYRDELTGLHTRRFFFEQAPLRLALARHRGEPVALVYVDLNGFKDINDTLGHQAGDDMLREVAACFQKALRDEDLFARFGGDEFVVLFSNVTEVEARQAAERLVACVMRPFHLSNGSLEAGVSVGVVVAPAGSDDLGELLKRADRAMYRAKGRKAHEPYAVEVAPLDIPDLN